MKKFLLAAGLLGAGASLVQAETTNDQLQAELTLRAEKNLAMVQSERRFEIKAGDLTYSGIAVAAVKADNKLQLINPLAPDKYGTVEDSVVRDLKTGAAAGLKVFAIAF